MGDQSQAALWAAAWITGARRFNPNHLPAGKGGGEFASAGSGSGGSAGTKGAKPSAHAAHVAHMSHLAVTQRKAQLHARANADRAQARKLEVQLHALQKQEAAAVAAAKHHAAAAKAAAKHHATVHKAAAAHHKARKAAIHHASLKQRISSLKTQISSLLSQAAQLDAQAAKL